MTLSNMDENFSDIRFFNSCKLNCFQNFKTKVDNQASQTYSTLIIEFLNKTTLGNKINNEQDVIFIYICVFKKFKTYFIEMIQLQK